MSSFKSWPNGWDIQENNLDRWEVILKAGGEGCCVTLFGMYNGKSWIFSRDVLDQTSEMINEPVVHYCSKRVYSWDDALEVLDKHPWHLFYPLEVHPVFQGAVLAAVLLRTMPEMIAGDYGFQQWLGICSELPRVEWKLAL